MCNMHNTTVSWGVLPCGISRNLPSVVSGGPEEDDELTRNRPDRDPEPSSVPPESSSSVTSEKRNIILLILRVIKDILK